MGSSGTARTSQDEDEEGNSGHDSVGPSADVFLAKGCSEPDTTSLRLMKSRTDISTGGMCGMRKEDPGETEASTMQEMLGMVPCNVLHLY